MCCFHGTPFSGIKERAPRSWDGEDTSPDATDSPVSLSSPLPKEIKWPVLSRRTLMAREQIEEDLAELKSRLEQTCLKTVMTENEQELKLLQNVTLHIAVTGNSGAAKSSFLNAFRSMTDYEEGAAKTGVGQTIMKPEKYPHPIFPEITLWDLPGTGTPKFQPKEYLKKVNFSRYDFFIIITAGHFTANDAMLASEIQKMNKLFYFVCTKVDQDMENERRKPNFSETQTLEEIRTSCLSNLTREGIVNPKVFLISRWHLEKYDFPILHKTLADDLNNLKRPLLIMAMPAFSSEHLQQKKAALKSLIWKKALKSCTAGVIFVPGLSAGYDIHLLVFTMKEICKAFALDEDSFHSLSKRVSKPVDVLRSAVRKTPMASQINLEYVWSFIIRFVLVSSAMVVKEVLRCIPILSSLVGAATPFATTYYMLNRFLDNAVEDAKSLLAKAAE